MDPPIKSLKPILDVRTRWNSSFEMIERALLLKPALRIIIQEIHPADDDEEPGADGLVGNIDWDRLKTLTDFLQPFKEATLIASASHYPSLSLVLPQYNSLLDHQEYFKDESEDQMLAAAAADAHSKLKNWRMEKEDKHILLILDNASSHSSGKELTNIELCFLLRNTTSLCQPLDQRIIAAFKARFRSKEVLLVLDRLNATEITDKSIYKIDQLTAMTWSKQAWESLEPQLIKNCWYHAGLIKRPSEMAEKELSSLKALEIAELDKLLRAVVADAESGSFDAVEYVSFEDEDLEVHETDVFDIDKAIQQLAEEEQEPEDNEVVIIRPELTLVEQIKKTFGGHFDSQCERGKGIFGGGPACCCMGATG